MAEDHTQNSTGSLAPVDKSVKVPKAVRDAAAQANAAYGPESTSTADTPQNPSQPSQPSQPSPSSNGNGQSNPQGSVSQPDNWQHRYDSIKGRYDQAQGQLQSQANRITQLESLLAQTSKPQAQPQSSSSSVPPELRASSLLTPQEIMDYGEDFLGVVGKKVEEVATPKITQLERQVRDLQLQLQGVGSHLAGSEREKLFAALANNIPNWQQVNTSKDFLDWLRLPDPYSGATRQGLLTQAFERNDIPRVMAFFKGFLAEEAAVDPAVSGPGTQRASQNGTYAGGRSSKTPLENYAAPGRAKSAASSSSGMGPTEKPIITPAQIQGFYSDIRAGKYRGRDEEKAKTEAMIFVAQAEGRIR